MASHRSHPRSHRPPRPPQRPPGRRHRPSWWLVAAQIVALAVTVACDDGGANESTTGDTASDDTAGPEAARLSACPRLSLTSDPSAGSCLAGTYEGTTPAGDACTLELRGTGDYEFSSPALSVSYTATDATIFVFDHTAAGGFEQVTWQVSDPIKTGTSHEFSFLARFGAGVPDTDSSIQIEVTEHVDSAMQSASCVVPL